MSTPKQASSSGIGAFRFSENNFDLIRLVAAGEVAVKHAVHHIRPESESGPVFWLLDLIPGVPVFFFLSGFLISRSLERASSLSDYFRNRALRLYPALWACTALSVLIVFACGYMASSGWTLWGLGLWIACQGTAFQFWNPEYFRGFGVGVVNGSLWSVSVEIQFYVAIVATYWVLHRLPKKCFNPGLAVLVVVFGLVAHNRSEISQGLDLWSGSDLAGRLFRVSFVPWYYMFLLGVLAQRFHATLVPLLVDRVSAVVAIYLSSLIVDHFVWGLPVGNEISSYLVPGMGCAVLAIAYSRPTLSDSVLGRNDVSYGVYIHHMPLVNLALWLGFADSWVAILAVLLLTIGLAFVSWRVVEQPWLSRKRGAQRAFSIPSAAGP
jgi:peptidoglycan/LPS O-acetylase OafA/YrhL